MLRKAHTRNSQSTGNGFIAHEGYLIKQGGARGGFKNWKRRWFAIKRDCLYYYKSRPTASHSTGAPDLNETDQPLLGVLPLLGANIIDVGNEPNIQLNAVCYECKRPFNMIQKRHICSICNQTFCKQCLGHKVSIPSMGFDKPIKACRLCYNAVVHDQQVRDQTETPDKALKSRLTAEAGDRPHVFLIQTPDRELLVQADSAELKLEWMTALREAIGKRRSGHLSDPLGHGLKPAKEQWEIDYSQLTFLAKIGDGAFGEVYKGRLWGSDVAIKKLKDSEVNEKVLTDLKKEVAILSQLRHPNIVLYIGACTQPPNICIVTEWCDRGSLYDIIYKQKMIIDTRRAMNIAIGLAQGMSYLHSLDGNIIHRDLKSHNVLLDSSFTVKIADFGLSHMRELNVDPAAADTDAGKFGIFGTPEWMAPEVMEGSAYTNKIDVYSFGVVLTEIFNRQVPLRDQYKINTYVDVFEAVLDDGARPTVPDWVGSTLQSLIQDCFNVIPAKRPTFMDLIARLTQAFHMSPKMIVKQYDVKRLIFMLDNVRPYMQELAARELAQMRPSCDVCLNCGQCPITTSMFEHDNIMLFVEKLSILFNAGPMKIKAQACAALVSLLSSASDKYRSTYSDIVLKEIGLGALMQFCSNTDEELGPCASGLVKQIALDLLRPHNNSIRELDRSSAEILEKLIANEILQLSEKLDRDQQTVQLKRDFMLKLKQSQFNVGKPSPTHRQTPSWHSSSLDVAAAPIEEMVVAGVVINKTFASSDIDILPAPSQLSDVFLNTFQLDRSEIIDCDHGLVYDPMTSEWLVCLLVLLTRQIHIFEKGAGQSSEDSCLAMVRVAANAPTQVAVGRKGSKPHCIHIIDDNDSMVICTRAASQCRFWAAILCPDLFPSPPEKPSSTVTILSTRELLDMLSENVVESRVPATSSSGWLLAHDPDTNIWYPTYGHFPPAKPNVMTLYETSNMNNIIMSIKVDSVRHQYDTETPKSAPESEEWISRLFSISGMLVKHLDYRDEERSLKPITLELCALSIGDRHGWVTYCSRICNRLPAIASNDSDDLDGLETLPQDIKQQLLRSSDPRKTSARAPRDISNAKTEPTSSGSYSVDETIAKDAANDSKISPQSEFVRQFGNAFKHGYLLKRGGFRKNWKLRYFYLVGNQLRYFPSHNSSPSECLGIIYTATGSGKRFSIYQETTNTNRHRFCIENPSRIWVLEAHSELQMKEWMAAIDAAASASDLDSGSNKVVE